MASPPTPTVSGQRDQFQEDGIFSAKCGNQAKEYRDEAESESPLYRTDEFRIYCFKVLPCSKRYCHDWTVCPFAHPGEKAKRRDCRVYSYTGIACPEMKSGQCPRGDACPYSHNVFEYWLHPSRYRTQLCNDGTNCKRKVCFFAHTLEELRVPPCKQAPAPSAPAALDMAAAAQLFGAAASPNPYQARAVRQGSGGLPPVRYASGEDPFMGVQPLGPQHASPISTLVAGGDPTWECTSSTGSLSPSNAVNGLVTPFAAVAGSAMDSAAAARPGPGGRSLSHHGSYSCPVPSSPLNPMPSPMAAGTPAAQRIEQLAEQLASLQLDINSQTTDPTVAGLLSMLVQEVRTARQQAANATAAAQQAQQQNVVAAAYAQQSQNAEQQLQRMSSLGALSPAVNGGGASGLARAPLYPLTAPPRLAHMQSLPAHFGNGAPLAPCSPVLSQSRRCNSIELVTSPLGPLSMSASPLTTPASSELYSSGSFVLASHTQLGSDGQYSSGTAGQQYGAAGSVAAMLGQAQKPPMARRPSSTGSGSGRGSPQCADLPAPAFSLCHSLFSQQPPAGQASNAEQLLSDAFGGADAAPVVSGASIMSPLGLASAGF